MPELPEVEVTRRGIAPALEGQVIDQAIVRHFGMRWPVPADLPARLAGQPIHRLERRGKYLLARLPQGSLLLHLGMSGSLRLVDEHTPPARHDHFDLCLRQGAILRLRDPRRFGAILWLEGDPLDHPLLRDLGPEPLTVAFDGQVLYRALSSRSSAIKVVLMDHHVVVGVGNIYANEALFLAGIRPQTPAKQLSRHQCQLLADAVKDILLRAIERGGSTLRDFVHSDGSSGYFQLDHWVYGRSGEPCRRCGQLVQSLRLGQRSTFYCGHCQS